MGVVSCVCNEKLVRWAWQLPFVKEMYKSMRFNDKELSYFALNLIPDKEGTLEKKGAVRGQGEVIEQRVKAVTWRTFLALRSLIGRNC